jgi:hypothetical protein
MKKIIQMSKTKLGKYSVILIAVIGLYFFCCDSEVDKLNKQLQSITSKIIKFNKDQFGLETTIKKITDKLYIAIPNQYVVDINNNKAYLSINTLDSYCACVAIGTLWSNIYSTNELSADKSLRAECDFYVNINNDEIDIFPSIGNDEFGEMIVFDKDNIETVSTQKAGRAGLAIIGVIGTLLTGNDDILETATDSISDDMSTLKWYIYNIKPDLLQKKIGKLDFKIIQKKCFK